MAMIKHHARQPADSKYAMHFANRTSCVRRVMQHTIRVNNVETLVRERKVLGIAKREVARLAIQLEMMTRCFDRTRREIDASHVRAAARELQKVRTHPTPDFKQTFSGEVIEAHHLAHPRSVLFVAVPLDFIKELARAEFMRPAINCPRGVVGPLIARTLLFVITSCWLTGNICHISGRKSTDF